MAGGKDQGRGYQKLNSPLTYQKIFTHTFTNIIPMEKASATKRTFKNFSYFYGF